MKCSAAALLTGALLLWTYQPAHAADVIVGLTNLDTDAKTFDITASHTEEIAGFQFTFESLSVTRASGGRAAENGFITPASGRIVLGTHRSEGTIPGGEGVLVTVTYTGEIGESICILDSIPETRIGGIGAVELSREIGPCLVPDPPPNTGCTDPDADNYDHDAKEEECSCQ